MKKKSFIIDWAIFPFQTLVCLAMSRNEVLKQVEKYGKISEEEKEAIVMNGQGRAVMLKGGQTILWMRFYPKPGSGVLAHEMVHVIDFVLERVGIEITVKNDELRGYMTEYFTNQVYKNL